MSADAIAKLLGDWSSQVNIASTALKTVIAIIMAVILGCERAKNRHAAGLRTLIVISIGSAIAGIADIYFVKELSATFAFLSAAVIIAIAVISANTIIFSSKNQIKGLTTSVGIWTMAIISAALGFGLYTTALIGFGALMIGIIAFTKLETYIKSRSSHLEVHLELKSRNNLQEFMGTIRKFGLKIDDMESNPAYANSGLGVYSVKLTVVGDELKNKKHADIIEALSALDCVYFIEEIG